MAGQGASFYSTFHRIVYSVWVIFFFSLHYPRIWFYAKSPQRHYAQLVRIRKKIAAKSATCSGFGFRIDHLDAVDWSRNYILCANHSSNLDITAMMLVCPTEFSFMGKKELLDNPVTRVFFKTIDIPVDRSNKRDSFKAFIRAKDLLIQKKSVAIFPEGGIDDHFPPQLSPFKAGAFKLAMDTGVPVLPIVIHNAWELCWDDGHELGMRPGICRITVLPLIESADFSDANALSNAVYSNMREVFINGPRNKKG